MSSRISFISKEPIHRGEDVKGQDIRQGVFDLILYANPGFTTDDYISLEELNQYRRLYLTQLVEQERGEIEKIDEDVMHAIRTNSILSENITDEQDEKQSLGDRIADKIASFGGSWTFIISFFTMLIIWMIINTIVLVSKPFDPYPFILLNLILSCLAAIQAPIIMMSQNRQEQKDRNRAEHDYKINLKAELEIKLLGEKMDHMIVHQNRKLLEIQEVQIDYLEDLMKKLEKGA
ncbi:MAG: DUF1003 domain-containing protein [Bacteroidia bacterium]